MDNDSGGARRRLLARLLNPTHRASWALLASVVAVATAVVALLPRGAESPSTAPPGSTPPPGPSVPGPSSADASSPGPSSPGPASRSAPSTVDTPTASPTVVPVAATSAPGGVRLYTLPGNSAGQHGSQRTPYDVTLAGGRYAESTGVWVTCSGGTSVTVTLYLGRRYQRLSAIAGIADFAPADLSVQIQVYTETGIWKWFSVTHEQSLPIDIDVSGVESIGFTASTPARCPHTTRPFAYLGDAVVSR